jgi:uncharacterized coiled-coil DUF342 family protein
MKLMLENKDIQKLKKILATKQDLKKFATKQDLNARTTKLLKEIFVTRENIEAFKEEVRKSFSDLQTAIDSYAKKVDTYTQEMIMLAHKVDRHEKWIHQIADKLGIKLEY